MASVSCRNSVNGSEPAWHPTRSDGGDRHAARTDHPDQNPVEPALQPTESPTNRAGSADWLHRASAMLCDQRWIIVVAGAGFWGLADLAVWFKCRRKPRGVGGDAGPAGLPLRHRGCDKDCLVGYRGIGLVRSGQV